MNKPNIGQFFQEVRQEGAKVTWPTRRETAISTGLVFVMVILAALFFLSVDWILSHLMKLLFGIGA
ncbi:MAG: preprotein translocase subunit SecE [Rhodospirillales bacterium]|jgi:preprotein translocase subunit SecE|nr:preprotein translocase subunit SecE [Rhodospirillales bacterium]